jgi:uridine kinase
VIIIEGHLLFTNPELLEMLNYKIFVDADDDVRLSRRILKMQNESVEALEAMLNKYETMVKPMYEMYIEPSKKQADMVIPNYGFSVTDNGKGEKIIDIEKCNMPAIDLIAQQIRQKIQNKI